jgi:hypothetical protein
MKLPLAKKRLPSPGAMPKAASERRQTIYQLIDLERFFELPGVLIPPRLSSRFKWRQRSG